LLECLIIEKSSLFKLMYDLDQFVFDLKELFLSEIFVLECALKNCPSLLL